METKIIKVVFGGRRYAVTAKRTRTDYGQMFEFVDIALPETFEVIFSNSATSAGTGKKMIGSNQRCLIPDEYLKTGQPIYAWILLHDGEGDGRHMYSIKSPVDDMPDTSPEEPTPVEQSIISQAITALNSAVTTTSQKAQEATESADRAEHAAEDVEGYAERAEAAQSASESAKDRAVEAETSARTSAATVSEKASEAISSATTASQSALTAENASESAQEYASASAESASQASQSADTASGKASDASEYASNASTSAQTASQKASEAAQNASTAVQAKTDAESAKTASETAQGRAESARDEAVSAKTDAESARDEAQDIVDGITGKVEQINSNTTRIESLEDDRYKPYAVDSASGSIASFADGADNIPLKSCIVQIEPVQAGSGDPSPENVRPITGWTGCEVQRTGVNVWDEEWELGGIYISNGQNSTSPTSIRTTNYINILPSTSYYAKTSATLGLRYYDENKNYLRNVNNVNETFTTPNNARYLRFSVGSTTVYNHDISINYPSTDHDYHPYTGQTYPITFPTEAGTVYGGYIDPINGELVTCPYYASYNGETLTGEWISDRDKYVAGATPTIGAQVVNIGAVGERYPITQQEIKTLLGTNNIWADTGNSEVEYRADTELYIEKNKPDVPVDDVQIDGTSIVTDGVANVPVASHDTYGVVRTNTSYGISIQSGMLRTYPPNSSEYKTGTDSYHVISPAGQHISTFYGLAKAAGYDEKDSTLPVGEYSEEAKIAIQKMLGIYEAPWELIEKITLEEESGFDKTVEPDGTPYNFRAAYVRITVPPNSTNIASGYGRWYFVDENNTTLIAESGRYTTSTAQMCKTILIERNANMAIAKFSSYASTGGRGVLGYKNITGISFDYGSIKRIYTNADDKEPAGAIIEIYAQRAY